MKTSFVIIALAQALAVASAPTSSDSGETGAMSVAQDVDHAPMSLLTASDDLSSMAYCGGFLAAECRNLCGALGYLYYCCLSDVCRCSNGAPCV